MKRKEFSVRKAIFVLVLTSIVFTFGLLVGNYMTNERVDYISDLSDDLNRQSMNLEVEYDILSENICENENILYLTDDLFDLARKIEYMENSLDSDDSRLIDLKDYYFVLEAKHWLLAKKRNAKCFSQNLSLQTSTILYFYSYADECPDCNKQAAVLGYLRQKYDGLNVYSFDYNSKSGVVDILKKLFKISDQCPDLVINGKTYYEYMDADDIISLFNVNKSDDTLIDDVKE